MQQKFSLIITWVNSAQSRGIWLHNKSQQKLIFYLDFPHPRMSNAIYCTSNRSFL